MTLADDEALFEARVASPQTRAYQRSAPADCRKYLAPRGEVGFRDTLGRGGGPRGRRNPRRADLIGVRLWRPSGSVNRPIKSYDRQQQRGGKENLVNTLDGVIRGGGHFVL